MNEKIYNVGIYIRLSKESGNYRGEESESIENQQAMLSKFITMMPNWVQKKTYIDDGQSGGNFNRQGFLRMMEDVKKGEINLVVVKDLSRFGRNYIESGKYLEEILPSLGCRFVALSDGIDTETGENDIIPFLNAVNDFYIKNLSARIKAVLRAKAKGGQNVSGVAPYGYKRNPEKNTSLIVDEYAAEIVKRIFEMRAEGLGYAAIAGVLNKENILPPRKYYFRYRENPRVVCSEIWSIRTVKQILNNETYIGNTISFKRRTLSYRDNRTVKSNKSQLVKVENTHFPIIDKALWQTVLQINNQARERFSKSRKPRQSLFSGVLICADCRGKIGYTCNTQKYAGYICKTHSQSGGAVCSRHKISENALKELAFEGIGEVANSIFVDEKRILDKINQKLISPKKIADRTKKRKEYENLLYSLECQLEQLYEEKVSGKITAETFAAFACEAERKHLETEDMLIKLKNNTESAKLKPTDLNKWKEFKIDRDLIEHLIEKIEIGESRIINGIRTQDLYIFFKCKPVPSL